jgi:hypothetical protein
LEAMPRPLSTNLPSSKLNLSWHEATTVILRNIPNNCSQVRLLSEISDAGFGGTFDFFYLPCDYETSANKGYAFVNFKLPSTTLSFRNVFHGKKLPNFKSQKIIQIEIASVQGFKANYEHFNSKQDLLSTLRPEFQPLFVFDLVPAKISLETAESFTSSTNLRDLKLQHDISADSLPVKVMLPRLVKSSKLEDISSLETSCVDSASEAATADTDDESAAAGSEQKGGLDKTAEKMQISLIGLSDEDAPAAVYRFSF